MSGIILASVGNSYGSLPINTDAPAVTGTVSIGSALSCSTGTWTGAPAPTFTYQWQQGTSTNISGATSSSYTIVSGDGGYTLRCVVTATNSLGAVAANSASTITVLGTTVAYGNTGTFTLSTGASWNSIRFVAGSSTKAVVAFRHGSGYGQAVVITRSGSNISKGTTAQFASSTDAYGIYVVTDPHDASKFIVSYTDFNNYYRPTVIVGSISGTTISYGSPVVFDSSSYPATTDRGTSVAYDPHTSGKCIVSWAYGYFKSAVGSISGTTITAGSITTLSGMGGSSLNVAYDPHTSGKFAIGFKQDASPKYGKLVVGSISGTTVTLNPARTFHSAMVDEGLSFDYDPHTSGKVLFTYVQNYGSGYGQCVIGTISGTSLSVGTPATYNSANTATPCEGRYDPVNNNKIIVVFRDDANSNAGTTSVGSVSGTTITFGNEYVFHSGNSYSPSIAVSDSASTRFIAVYEFAPHGKAITGTYS
jgi:hypothetical protein